MVSRKEARQIHRKRNCLFCKWVDNWKDFRVEEDYRLITPENRKGFFAILALEPKVFGHTLLISTDPFDNIYHEIEGLKDSKTALLNALPIFCRAVKEGLHAEIAYVMSMCDHYDEAELHGRHSTEHFHFHILPRYSGNERGEHLFCLSDKHAGVDWEANPLFIKRAKEAIVSSLIQNGSGAAKGG